MKTVRSRWKCPGRGGPRYNQGSLFSVNWERTILAGPFLGVLSTIWNSVSILQGEGTVRRPIASFQAIQHKIAEMAAIVEAAKLLVYHQAWMIDNDIFCLKETSLSSSFWLNW